VAWQRPSFVEKCTGLIFHRGGKKKEWCSDGLSKGDGSWARFFSKGTAVQGWGDPHKSPGRLMGLRGVSINVHVLVKCLWPWEKETPLRIGERWLGPVVGGWVV